MLGTIKFIERSRSNYWFLSKRLKVSDCQNKLQYNNIVTQNKNKKKFSNKWEENCFKAFYWLFISSKGETKWIVKISPLNREIPLLSYYYSIPILSGARITKTCHSTTHDTISEPFSRKYHSKQLLTHQNSIQTISYINGVHFPRYTGLGKWQW